MSFITDLVERVRALMFRRREDRELAEELRLHAEMEAAHRRERGTDPGEARRQSLAALGGIERVKEDVRDARGTRLLEDGVGDVRYALRTLARSPGFAAVVILTLAVGIGGTTAVFSAVDAVLLQPLPYQEPGRLVRLYSASAQGGDSHGFISPVHYVEFRSQLQSVESIAAIAIYSETGADIGRGGDVHRIRLLPTTANYFDVVRVQPALGRAYQQDDENGSPTEDVIEAAPVVVLSHQVWEDQFHGDASAIGRSLVMNGKNYRVAGVMPAGFTDPIAGAIDAWVPLDLAQARDPNEAGNHYLSLIARLKPGVTIGRAQAEVNALSLRLAEKYPNQKDERARFYPLKEDLVGASSRSLEIMLGAVGLVLLLVSVNIANLVLVRGSERSREFAVRTALGGSSARLVRQLLTESLTLAIGGALAGLIVARLSMSAIVALGAGTIPRLSTLSLDPRLLLVSLALATGCALIFGLVPALRATRTQPSDAMRDQSRGATSGGRSLRLREWLVVSQVAVTFVLLVGAGLLLASLRKIQEIDLGVRPANVLTFELNLPSARYDSTARATFFDAFAARVAALPGVRAAGAISKLPATGPFHQWGTLALTGPLAADEQRRGVGAQNRIVSGDYFRAVGIRLLAGRLFDASDDAHAPDRVVISKILADRLFPGVAAVGQSLRSGGRNAQVIGVVSDVAVDNEGRQDNFVYHPHRQFAGDRNWSLTQVIATKGPATAMEPEVRRALADADPQLVMFRPVTLEDAIGRGAAQRVFTLRILMTFAVIALALCALGLFGVLAYGVKLRSREFGIRMALGADRGAIGRMILGRGLIVTGVGIVIGLAGAVALSKVMTSVLFHVSALDSRVLIGTVLFLGIVAAVAAYLPAHQATGVDPRTVLQ
ncbi:MAG: ADOP family duplicated permease [Gemmatimonadales bacterium]